MPCDPSLSARRSRIAAKSHHPDSQSAQVAPRGTLVPLTHLCALLQPIFTLKLQTLAATLGILWMPRKAR